MEEKVSELERLERLIVHYKSEADNKRKHIVYISLIQETLKLVKKIVASFYPLPISVTKDDLIQVGALGVLRAIETYKVEERGSFKTYVSKVVKGKIFHYLRDKANLVKTPRESLAYLPRVREAVQRLIENNSKTPTAEEVASIVDIPVDKVEEIMNIEYLKNMVSLDQNVYSSDGGETLLDRIAQDTSESFEDMYANKKVIEDALNRLPENDRIAISMYYIDGENRKEISKRLKVSTTQVSRILRRALNRLYVIMSSDLLDNNLKDWLVFNRGG